MNYFKPYNLIIFFLIMVSGFLGGVIGGILVNNSFLKNNQVYQNCSLPLSATSSASTFLKKDYFFSLPSLLPRKVPSSLDNLRDNAVVLISKDKIDNSSLPFRSFSPQDIATLAFVVTDDGWIATVGGEWEKIPFTKLLAINKNKAFSLEKKIKDPSTSIVFLKIKTSQKDFLPLSLGKSEDVYPFSLLFAVDYKGQAQEFLARSLKKQSFSVKSTELLSKRIILDKPASAGQALVDDKGDIVGIVSNEKKEVIPIDYLKSKLDEVLDKDKISRVYLGVNYIDLNNHFLLDRDFLGFGVLVYHKQHSLAVAKNSPAQKNGLRYGDIILSVEGEEIGVKKDLSEIIQEYHPGVEVEFVVLRGGQEKKINIKLEELSDKR